MKNVGEFFVSAVPCSLLAAGFLCRSHSPSPQTSAEQSWACHSQKLTNHSVAFKFRWLSSRGFQMIKTCRSSQTRAKWKIASCFPKYFYPFFDRRSTTTYITSKVTINKLFWCINLHTKPKKHNIFKHRIPLRVFAPQFLTFYKLLYNWLSCSNSSILIGYSYTMGTACPALFSRRLWGGRMGPTQKNGCKEATVPCYSSR